MKLFTQTFTSFHLFLIRYKTQISIGVLVVSLLYHFYTATRFFNSTISDIHGFRQTQTALSSLFMSKQGLSLAYPLPVFGEPWSAPIEFPLYQWLVTILSKSDLFTLAQWGRVVNLFFFYASLMVAFFLIKKLNYTSAFAFIVLSFCLTSPIYTFWARTFMMETTALFFSVLSVLLFAICWKKYSHIIFVLFIAISSLAAALKITTFVVWAFFIVSFLSFENGKLDISKKKILFMCSFIVPLMASIIWNKYTDSIKILNPFGNFLSSTEHWKGWINIPLNEHFSLFYWDRIVTSTMIVQKWLIPFLIFALIIKFDLKLIILFLSIWIGPFLFTILYYQHEYYSIVQGIFIAWLYAQVFKTLFETKWKITSFLIIPSFVFITYIHHYKYNYYYQYRLKSDTEDVFMQMGDSIAKLTSPNDVLLILGIDWNPVFAYYAGRKSIMLKEQWIRAIGKDSTTRLINQNKYSIIVSFEHPIDSMKYAHGIKLEIDSIPIYSRTEWPGLHIYRRVKAY